MVTIDLTTPPPPAESFLDGLPRRVAVTLPELQLVARLAGDAPLPFTVAGQAEEASGLSHRLGQSRGLIEDEAYRTALGSLHDPAETLTRRGLLVDGVADRGLLGAVGLLATPRVALDIDVAADGTQVKAWHRCADGAVATLSTCDGIVFELAWFAADQWADELARVTAVPDDVTTGASAVPALLDAPYATIDAIGEALRNGRIDLVPVLIANARNTRADDEADMSVRSDDVPLGDPEAAAALSAVHTESRGRVRILAAQVSEHETTGIGVISWVLLADGWHSITPHHDAAGSRVRVSRVEPTDLATELAPVLAQVTS